MAIRSSWRMAHVRRSRTSFCSRLKKDSMAALSPAAPTLATTLTAVGGGEVALNTESVRGSNATEALADLLMGQAARCCYTVPWARGGPSGHRHHVDAQPAIEVTKPPKVEWTIAVDRADAEVTAFSAPDELALPAARGVLRACRRRIATGVRVGRCP